MNPTTFRITPYLERDDPQTFFSSGKSKFSKENLGKRLTFRAAHCWIH